MINKEFWKNKRILITGGSGFIGSNLANTLYRLGSDVVIIDKLLPKNIEYMKSPQKIIKFKEINLVNYEWDQLLLEEKFDVIFHLAGNANVSMSVQQPDFDFESNVSFTFAMLNTMRRINWKGILIFPSSAAVYGNPQKMPIFEIDPTFPISPYGVSKLTIERYIAVFCHLYGLKAACVRPFSVYGPFQRKLVVYDLICKIIKNPNSIDIFGDGSQTRDFIYISDLINAVMIIVEKGNLKGEIYNIGSGQSRSILNVVDTICNTLNLHPKYNFSGMVRPGEPEKWTVNIDRIQSLGFSNHVSFEDGISKVINWYFEAMDQDEGDIVLPTNKFYYVKI